MDDERSELAVELFHRYEPMLNHAAWVAKYKFKWMEFDELQAQAYLIFMEALEKWDPDKASFSTFLYSRLRTINDYCVYLMRRYCVNYEKTPQVHADAYDVFETVLEEMEVAVELSDDARDVLAFILQRDWEVPGTRLKPSFHVVTKIYRKERGWMPKRFKDAWDELDAWWDVKLRPA